MTLFFQFVTFALPSPSYFLFSLVRVAYLSLSGGTSCHRSMCWCIPLVTGLMWDQWECSQRLGYSWFS